MELNQLIKKGKINALNRLNVEEFLISNNDYVVKVKDKYEVVLVKDYIQKQVLCDDKRLLDSLKLVALSESILMKKMNILSNSELLKIELAIQLIKNSFYIVLFRFDRFFMEKDLLFFKKLFKKLATEYQKTIVLLDCKIDFMFNLVDRIVVKNERNELIVFSEPDFYDDHLLQLLEVPKIIDFVQYVNQKEKRLNHYIDLKELIKAIYREV